MFFIMGGDALFLSLCALLPLPFLKSCAPQMQHAVWEGFTFYDLIFPLFLFLAGVSFPLSLTKQRSNGKSNHKISLRIVRRGCTLILLGMVYNGLLQFDFEGLRYASVLGRIGSAWMLAALVYVWCGRKWSVVISVSTLLGYWALLLWVGAPDSTASHFSMEGNIVSYVDRLLLPGTLHNGIHDPEGLLSTLPAMVTAQLGIFVGEFITHKGKLGNVEKSLILIAVGVALLLFGYLWSASCPLNKNLWSSSFVLVSGGWSVVLLTMFYLVVDVVGFRRWAFFFQVIGVNSITIYLLQQFVDFHHINSALFGGIFSLLPSAVYATAYWLAYVMLCWGLLYFLYKKNTFLKV